MNEEPRVFSNLFRVGLVLVACGQLLFILSFAVLLLYPDWVIHQLPKCTVVYEAIIAVSLNIVGALCVYVAYLKSLNTKWNDNISV